MAGQVAAELVTVGKLTGLFGVRGWFKVFSHTDPLENILAYRRWYCLSGGEWRPYTLEDGRRHGKGVIAKFEGCDDRDAAALLIGSEIAIERSQLPRLGAGEYYWSDLIGLEVVTTDGVSLGHVDHLLETGSNDVLVVHDGERERLLPYDYERGQVVRSIDTQARRVVVDWDPEF